MFKPKTALRSAAMTNGGRSFPECGAALHHHQPPNMHELVKG
jgi:hypothetical protein